jgi:hypothetical protein
VLVKVSATKSWSILTGFDSESFWLELFALENLYFSRIVMPSGVLSISELIIFSIFNFDILVCSTVWQKFAAASRTVTHICACSSLSIIVLILVLQVVSEDCFGSF